MEMAKVKKDHIQHDIGEFPSIEWPASGGPSTPVAVRGPDLQYSWVWYSWFPWSKKVFEALRLKRDNGY